MIKYVSFNPLDLLMSYVPQRSVTMDKSDSLVDQLNLKVELKSASMMPGEQSVMSSGPLKIRMLSVENLDFHSLV